MRLRWKSSEVDTPRANACKNKPQPDKPEVNKAPDEKPKAVEYQAVRERAPTSYTKAVFDRHACEASENAQVASLRPNEIATDFIPLRYMNAANLQDGGQIVRVELPRSALANFGLPVNMERYNEKVKADVLLRGRWIGPCHTFCSNSRAAERKER